MSKFFKGIKNKLTPKDPDPFPTGLKLLYDGSHVDIVFVHGLTGNRITTWQDDGGCLWPQDLLPKELPNARILTFGYDADVIRWKTVSGNRIGNHAMNLLSELARYRGKDNTEDRPIIFVVHSLGGLVCEDALRLSWRRAAEEHHQKIGKCTRGIAFLGTPHSGSTFAAWAEPLARCIGPVKQANHKILAVLERDSEVLARIQDDFHTEMSGRRERGDDKIQVTCFFEELPMTGIGAIVPKHSAIIPGYTSIGIHSNHTGMSRFKSPEDPGFLSVTGELERWMKRIPPVTKHEVQGPHYPESLVSDCLRSLTFSSIDNRRTNIKIAHEGTCDWIFRAKEFNDWINRNDLAQNDAILWIKGNPGVGKSTILKHIFTYCEAKFSLSHVLSSYFFHARGGDLDKTAFGMMRTLVYHLIDTNPDLRPGFLARFSDKRKKHGNNVKWTLDELQEILVDTIESCNGHAFFFFIDALDECQEAEARKIVDFLRNLSSRAQNAAIELNICLSSRHYPHITLDKKIELVVEKQPEHEKDILKYTKDRLKVRDHKIESKVLAKAKGIFMWLVLVIGLLNQDCDHGDIGTMHARLESVPSDLDELFIILLKENNANEKQTVLMLQLVLFSDDFLTPEDLYYGVLAGSTPEDLEPRNRSLHTDKVIRRFILSRSKGLVELRKVEYGFGVQFIHQTVNDFLLRNGRLRVLDPTLGNFAVAISQSRLADCCLSYVTMEALISLEFTPDWSDDYRCQSDDHLALCMAVTHIFPFLRYALKNLLSHITESYQSFDEVGQEMIAKKFVDQFLRQKTPLRQIRKFHSFLRWKADDEFPTIENDADILHIISRLGSPELISILLRQGVSPSISHKELGYPLQAACKFGSPESVRVLLTAGADLSSQGGRLGSALLAASNNFYHSKTVTKILLDALVDSNGGRELHASAFHAARSGGSDEIIKKLLQAEVASKTTGAEHFSSLYAAVLVQDWDTAAKLIDAGADVNFQKEHHNTILQVVVQEFDSDIVIAKLLCSGADVNAFVGDDYGTALQMAAVHDNPWAVKMLLDAGAKVGTQGGLYGNALQAALAYPAYTEDLETIELLLDAGADANAFGGRYGTALQAAACNGKPGAVRILLDAGAEVGTQGGLYGNALQAAAAARMKTFKNPKKMEMLLDAGADANASGGRYGTALQAAAASGNPWAVKMLLDAGAEINAESCGLHRNALLAAISNRRGAFEVVQILVGAGMNVVRLGGRYGNFLSAAIKEGPEALEAAIYKVRAAIYLALLGIEGGDDFID